MYPSAILGSEPPVARPLRRISLVLGDQLWLQNPALLPLDPRQDAVLMIEAAGEASSVWSHKQRIAVFLAAMRHFAQAAREAGMPLIYAKLDDEELPQASLADRLTQTLVRYQPQELHLCEPGERRIQEDIEQVAVTMGVKLVVHPDTHFLCSKAEFVLWAKGRKELRMEHFYRYIRRKLGVLMDRDGEPTGGQWNFDAENRSAYPKTGPGDIPAPAHFEPDDITSEVIELVNARFNTHPGSTEAFGWPVTRQHGLEALHRFIEVRLAHFGTTQDAMWTRTPFGWHSLLSVALNLHLIHPLEVAQAAEAAFHERGLDLAGVEGFIRQIIGWREFIRGVYWLYPSLKTDNHFNHQRPLPNWYWTGKTQMACMADTIGQTLEHGYAHHIQRLMVTGQFALLAEVSPQAVADWYLAVYVDAIEWVELPNVAGMTLYANGGKFTSKPYIASGAYIQRQSNYCSQCRYKPAEKTGSKACPFTTLYWAFLDKHEQELAGNPRTSLMVKHVQRMTLEQREAIRSQAALTLTNLHQL